MYLGKIKKNKYLSCFRPNEWNTILQEKRKYEKRPQSYIDYQRDALRISQGPVTTLTGHCTLNS